MRRDGVPPEGGQAGHLGEGGEGKMMFTGTPERTFPHQDSAGTAPSGTPPPAQPPPLPQRRGTQSHSAQTQLG